MLVAHVADLLNRHGLLLSSNRCVLLHGAAEPEVDTPQSAGAERQAAAVSGVRSEHAAASRSAAHSFSAPSNLLYSSTAEGA